MGTWDLENQKVNKQKSNLINTVTRKEIKLCQDQLFI